MVPTNVHLYFYDINVDFTYSVQQLKQGSKNVDVANLLLSKSDTI